MKITHHKFHFLALVFAFQLVAASAFCATTNWYELTRDMKVGTPEETVRKALDIYKQESWQTFTNSYSQFAQCLVAGKTAIWRVDINDWPIKIKGIGDRFYIIAVFSDGNKLSDLLEFKLPIGFTPRIQGIYTQRLKSIKVGMNVDDIYRLLGQKSPVRYYRNNSKRWIVEFVYSGPSASTVVFYQADAATGEIKGSFELY
jgi:hypothetical protein